MPFGAVFRLRSTFIALHGAGFTKEKDRHQPWTTVRADCWANIRIAHFAEAIAFADFFPERPGCLWDIGMADIGRLVFGVHYNIVHDAMNAFDGWLQAAYALLYQQMPFGVQVQDRTDFQHLEVPFLVPGRLGNHC